MIVDYQKASVGYDGINILNDINFQAEKGDFIFLTGKVGSGKTSFLRTLYGMLPVTGDRTYVLDYDMQSIKRKKLPELRRRLGIIFQDFQLLPDRTVYANLEFVLKATGWKKSDIPAHITEVLTQVGLNGKEEKYPHELSGGEQQRVAIARAILNTPELIIADEPTGNLDIETSKAILEILFRLTQSGTTVIMSTHNLNLIHLVNARVFNFEDKTMTEVSNSTSESSGEDMAESHEEIESTNNDD
jgi:cell division transport system ATP-binding protein